VRNTMIGANSRIEQSTIANSLVGDHVVIEKFSGELTVGDHTEMRGGA